MDNCDATTGGVTSAGGGVGIETSVHLDVLLGVGLQTKVCVKIAQQSSLSSPGTPMCVAYHLGRLARFLRLLTAPLCSSGAGSPELMAPATIEPCELLLGRRLVAQT